MKTEKESNATTIDSLFWLTGKEAVSSQFDLRMLAIVKLLAPSKRLWDVPVAHICHLFTTAEIREQIGSPAGGVFKGKPGLLFGSRFLGSETSSLRRAKDHPFPSPPPFGVGAKPL